MHFIGLRTNALTFAFGIDSSCPEFSWTLSSDRLDCQQSAYEVQVALDEDFAQLVWDSGQVSGDKPFGVPYSGQPLRSCCRYHWRVRVWDDCGVASGWSQSVWFETAYLDPGELQGAWIGLPVQKDDGRAALYLRRTLELPASVVKGRAYVSALGWYRFFVNRNDLVGNALVPRWTPLDHVVEYQTYDVTECFREGINVIAMAVGDGRYRGKLGASSRRACYGDRLAGFVCIELELANGSRCVLRSDESWEAGRGRILRSDSQDGEVADLRLSDEAWLGDTQRLPSFDAAVRLPASSRRLVAEEVARVEEVSRLSPIGVIRAPSGKQIIDFGQNFAGQVRIRLPGSTGTHVRLTYSELLNQSGELDTEYLKLPLFPLVLQRDEVILDGSDGWYQPWFTTHGLRYMEIDGLSHDLQLDEVEGIVLSSRLQDSGSFVCSDLRLNRLHQNVMWSLRSNFVDTPTDCPTRERSGWTGDIQVFADTATKLVDVQAYLRRYLGNLSLEQLSDGRVPPFIPAEVSQFSGGMPRLEYIHSSSAGWGDVSIMLPWCLYRQYGDREVLARQYPSMQRWLGFLLNVAQSRRGRGRWFAKRVGKLERYIVDGSFHWGEWLRPGDGIAKILQAWAVPEARVATAYLANSARLLANIAEVLHRPEDAQRYRGLWLQVRAAWRAAFVHSDGRIGKNRQDDYVRALAFDLLEPAEQPAALACLIQLIEDNGDHLDTGFLSTPMLLPTLAKYGRADVAYRLLLQTTTPSWLGQIERGATTLWETWEGYQPDGKAKMSHNHYAFGAVAGWLYEGIAGLSAAEPGYRRIRVAPCIGGGLTHASASIQTPYGLAGSAWRLQGNEVHLQVIVPSGSQADVLLGNGRTEVVGAGNHQFVWSLA